MRTIVLVLCYIYFFISLFVYYYFIYALIKQLINLSIDLFIYFEQLLGKKLISRLERNNCTVIIIL